MADTTDPIAKAFEHYRKLAGGDVLAGAVLALAKALSQGRAAAPDRGGLPATASPAAADSGSSPDPHELTIKDAAKFLGVSARTVRRYMYDGTLLARDAAPRGGTRPLWRIQFASASALRNAHEANEPVKAAPRSSDQPRPYTPKILTGFKPI